MVDEEPFPDIEDDDTDDVSWQLETGRSMWLQGDAREALRWLKRAAEAAEEAGNDARSLTLAKAAADIRARLEDAQGPLSEHPEQTAEANIPSPPRTPDPATAEPSGAGQSAPPKPPPSRPAPPQSASSAPSRPAPPPAGSEAPAPSPSRPAPPKAPPPSRPAPPKAPPSAVAKAPAASPSRPAPPKTPPPAASPSRPAPPKAPADQESPSQPRSAPPKRPPDRRDAVRVAVQPLADKPGFYVVRPLGAGEHAAKGLKEALLVALDDEPLLSE